MLKSKYQVKFKRDFKKFKYRTDIVDELDKVLSHLIHKKKLPKKYKERALSGNYTGYRECHIKPDVLLIYKIDKEAVTLTRIGSHSEVF